MCIIMVKPEAVKLPPYGNIENCWLNNDDGMGFMTVIGGLVCGFKGYKRSEIDLMYQDMQKHEDRPIIAHWRLATHGMMDQTAAHPFPVTDNIKQLRRHNWKSDLGVAHNGILVEYGSRYYHKGNGLSDTQDFILQVLAKKEVKGSIFKRSTKFLLSVIIDDSKLAFLHRSGRMLKLGKFVEGYGCWWSNKGFKEVMYPMYSYGNSGYWIKNQSGVYKYEPYSVPAVVPNKSPNTLVTTTTTISTDTTNKQHQELHFDETHKVTSDCDAWCPFLTQNCYQCNHLAFGNTGRDDDVYCDLDPDIVDD